MAYHIGPGAMHNLKEKYGNAWAEHLSTEQSQYLNKFKKVYISHKLFQPPTMDQYEYYRQSNTQIKPDQKIDVSVDIKGNTASATVRHNSKVVKRKDVRLAPSAAVVNS